MAKKYDNELHKKIIRAFDIIGAVNDGETVSCPECIDGVIVGMAQNDDWFFCNKCNICIHLSRRQ